MSQLRRVSVCFWFSDALQNTLEETEQLLSELSVMTQPRRACIDQMAKTLDNLETVAETQVNELSRWRCFSL